MLLYSPGEKRFKCDYCGYRIYQNSVVKRHALKHVRDLEKQQRRACSAVVAATPAATAAAATAATPTVATAVGCGGSARGKKVAAVPFVDDGQYGSDMVGEPAGVLRRVSKRLRM